MKNPRPAPRCFGVEQVGRGDAKTDPHRNREPGGFIVTVAERFSFREDWHRDDRVVPLVRQYQLTLDAALRRHPDWQGCAVHCCHCGIRFFTHPRNAGREDLRCPFGCREHHRRQCANARSRKHNQTPEGRANKKKLNIAARLKAGQAASRDTALPASVEPSSQLTADSPRGDCSEATTVDAAPPVEVSPALLAQLRLNLDGFVLDESTLVNSRVLPYVRMVVSVLEGRTIGREQLLVALRKRIRQRSIGRLSRREYVLHYLQQHPP